MAPATGNRTWSPVALLGLFTLSVVLFSLTLSLLVHPWIHLPLWKVMRRCASISATLSLWWIVTRVEKRTIRSYGFSPLHIDTRQLLVGVGLGVASLALLFGIGLITGACEWQLTPDRFKLWRTVLGFIPAAALIGVLEELVFRGFILQHLVTYSRPLAVAVSSVSYSLVHLRDRSWGMTTGLELTGLFLLGLVLAISYLRTQQLYLAVGLHASLAYGARVNKLVMEFSNPSLSWLTGTSRLINGVGSWIVLLGILGLIVRWMHPPHRGGLHEGQVPTSLGI